MDIRPLRSARLFLVLILAVSVFLRVLLALRGGQYYWPDESRYGISREAAAAVAQADWTRAGDLLLGTSDHVLFRFLGLIPAALERCIWPAEPAPPAFAAIFFGLFSVASIGVVWLAIRRSTWDESAASWSAFFYAGTVTGLYFTRHYFPYDVALFFFVAAWWIGLGPKSGFRSWSVGFTVGLGYLTYNAYWNTGGLMLLAFCFFQAGSLREVVRRGLWAGAGLLFPVVVALGAAALLGHNLIAHAIQFSHTVTQGDFGGGARFLFDYFRESEGLYLALLLAVVAVGLVGGIPHERVLVRAGSLWLALAVCLGAELVFFSDIVPRFAIAGRMAKPEMLFLAVGAGVFCAAGARRLGRWYGVATTALALVCIARNFSVPVGLEFPEHFKLRAGRALQETLSRDPDASLGRLNAHFFHRPQFLPPLPPGDDLLAGLHPLQFRPYVYEGYSRPMRDAFAAHDFRMRLVRFRRPDFWRSAPPGVERELAGAAGVVELALKLPDRLPVGSFDPLLVTGIAGRGDIVGLRYLAPDTVQVAFDHWGVGLISSPPIRLSGSAGDLHTLVLSMGSLLPAAESSYFRENPRLAPLRRRFVAEWDGKVVCTAEATFHPAPSATVTLAVNRIGGSLAGASFSGQLAYARRCDPRSAARREWGLELPEMSPMDAKPGGLHVVFDMPRESLSGSEPLFASHWSLRDFELVLEPVSGGGGEVALVLSFNGRELARSLPFSLPPGRHEAWILSPPMPRIRPAGATASFLEAYVSRVFRVSVDGRQRLECDLKRPFALEEDVVTHPLEPMLWAAGSDWPLTGRERVGFSGTIESAEVVPFENRRLSEWMFPGSVIGQPSATEAGGAVAIRLRFSPSATGSEPLVVTGRSGAGDVVYVTYEGGHQIRICHDHWGQTAFRSEPIEVDVSREHTLIVSTPVLRSSPAGEASPNSSPAGRLYVALDGRVLWDAEQPFHRGSADDACFGWNIIEASSCGPRFTGELIELRYVPEP